MEAHQHPRRNRVRASREWLASPQPAMTKTGLLCLLLLAALITPGAGAEAPSRTLSLPARAIFSKGPNEWNGDVLEITKGRGATIAWYISARQEAEVSVSIEYSCAQSL